MTEAECTQCRDWGKYEMHSDHAKPTATKPNGSELRYHEMTPKEVLTEAQRESTHSTER